MRWWRFGVSPIAKRIAGRARLSKRAQRRIATYFSLKLA